MLDGSVYNDICKVGINSQSINKLKIANLKQKFISIFYIKVPKVFMYFVWLVIVSMNFTLKFMFPLFLHIETFVVLKNIPE